MKIALVAAACALTLAASPTRASAQTSMATVVSKDFPARVPCGSRFEAAVTLLNSGDSTWTAGVALAARKGTNPFSESPRVALPNGLEVPPGESHIFKLALIAPEIPLEGVPTAWQLADADGTPFGDVAEASVSVECPARVNDSELLGAVLPTALDCGQSFEGSIAMLNTGTTTWSGESGYRLAVTEREQQRLRRTSVAGLPRTLVVEPGASHTFAVSITAPTAEGKYDVVWQMVQPGAGIFGQAVEQTISVGCPEPPRASR